MTNIPSISSHDPAVNLILYTAQLFITIILIYIMQMYQVYRTSHNCVKICQGLPNHIQKTLRNSQCNIPIISNGTRRYLVCISRLSHLPVTLLLNISFISMHTLIQLVIETLVSNKNITIYIFSIESLNTHVMYCYNCDLSYFFKMKYPIYNWSNIIYEHFAQRKVKTLLYLSLAGLHFTINIYHCNNKHKSHFK